SYYLRVPVQINNVEIRDHCSHDKPISVNVGEKMIEIRSWPLISNAVGREVKIMNDSNRNQSQFLYGICTKFYVNQNLVCTIRAKHSMQTISKQYSGCRSTSKKC